MSGRRIKQLRKDGKLRKRPVYAPVTEVLFRKKLVHTHNGPELQDDHRFPQIAWMNRMVPVFGDLCHPKPPRSKYSQHDYLNA